MHETHQCRVNRPKAWRCVVTEWMRPKPPGYSVGEGRRQVLHCIAIWCSRSFLARSWLCPAPHFTRALHAARICMLPDSKDARALQTRQLFWLQRNDVRGVWPLPGIARRCEGEDGSIGVESSAARAPTWHAYSE